MDLNSLVKVLLKVAGIYFLVLVVLILPPILSGNLPGRASAGAWFSVGIWGVAGIALLLFPNAIANHVIRIRGPIAGDKAAPSDLVNSGVRLLGCYFVLSTLSGLVYKTSIVWIFNNGIASFVLNPTDKANLFSAVIEIAIGLLLWIFGNPMGGVERKVKQLLERPASTKST
jgi:hypothetical protein